MHVHKISKKLAFLAPATHPHMWVSGGKNVLNQWSQPDFNEKDHCLETVNTKDYITYVKHSIKTFDLGSISTGFIYFMEW